MKEEMTLSLLVLALFVLLVTGASMMQIALAGVIMTGLCAVYTLYQDNNKYDKQWLINRVKLEIIALRRTVWFHETNSNLEKLLALALFATWSVITIGVAFGYAEATEQYAIITALMWMMIGKMWGGAMKDVSSGAG